MCSCLCSFLIIVATPEFRLFQHRLLSGQHATAENSADCAGASTQDYKLNLKVSNVATLSWRLCDWVMLHRTVCVQTALSNREL